MKRLIFATTMLIASALTGCIGCRVTIEGEWACSGGGYPDVLFSEKRHMIHEFPIGDDPGFVLEEYATGERQWISYEWFHNGYRCNKVAEDGEYEDGK